MSYPFYAQTAAGSVTVVLNKNEPAPPVPYELQNAYTSEIWESRVQATTLTVNVWSRPVTERIYFFAALITQFIVPPMISNLVLVNIYASGPDGRIPPERFFEFRAVGMSIFLGIFILFWTPLITWKLMGRRRLRALENQWLSFDRITSGGGFVPRWRLSKPGIFSSRTAIRVTVPPATVMLSNFHPNAPLPPYINPAGSETAAYGYGYPADEKTARPYPV